MNSSDIMVTSLVVAAALTAASSFYSSGAQIVVASFTFGRGSHASHALNLSFFYLLTVFGVMFLVGLGLLGIVTVLPDPWAIYILALAGAWTVMAGVLKIYCYLIGDDHRSPQITLYLTNLAQQLAAKAKTLPQVVLLGSLMSGIDLIWTGALYVAVVTTIHQYTAPVGSWFVLLYSLAFVLPLLIILVLLSSGTKVSALQRWKDQNKRRLQLIMGLLLIGLGGGSIALANGGISLG